MINFILLSLEVERSVLLIKTVNNKPKPGHEIMMKFSSTGRTKKDEGWVWVRNW